MKKIILLICTIVLFSCTNDEKANTNNTFNPPLWIQGTWGTQTDSASLQALFKFTTDDFILVTLNTERSQKDQIEQNKKLGANVIVTEEITNSIYNLTIKTTSLSGSITTIYKFKKVDATHISTDFWGYTTVLDKL